MVATEWVASEVVFVTRPGLKVTEVLGGDEEESRSQRTLRNVTFGVTGDI